MVNKIIEEEDLKFIKRAASGKYAPVDDYALKYVRIQAETDDTDTEENLYCYSIG